MATTWVTKSLRSQYFSLIVVILLCCFHHTSCYRPEILKATCQDRWDLRGLNLQSGIVVSNLPQRIPIYPNPDQYCDIYISFSEGSEMVFYFESLDLYSSSGGSRCDSTNIQLFDGSTGVPVRGLERPICGRLEEMPTQVYYVLNRMLIIRANSMGDVQGSGFSIHFTVYRKGFPCNREEFSCEDYDAHSGGTQQGFKRCVDSELVCDDYNDCGDWADERQNCNDLTAGAIAAIVIVAVSLVALVIGLIIFCKIRHQREMHFLREKGDAASAAVMRDTSFGSRGGMMSPFSISSETMEKEKYIPRYSTGRNSSRARSVPPPTVPGYEEHPPPYTEKAHPDASTERGMDYDEQTRSRVSRRRDRSQDREPDEVFRTEDEDEAPRSRRGKSRSQEREPRDDRLPPRDDRPALDRDDRRPAREREDDRYPTRRDDLDRNKDRDPPRGRYDDDKVRDPPRGRYDDDRVRDQPRGRYDDDRVRDPPRGRYDDDRDRDRFPSRNDPRDRDRERDQRHSRTDDRDRVKDPSKQSDRERPISRRVPPEDPEDDMMDQLHPLRRSMHADNVRRSIHTDSDHDTSREEGRSLDHSRDNDSRRRAPPTRDDEDHNHRPPREERDRRDREDDRLPRDRNRGSRDDLPRNNDDRPERNSRQPPSRNDSREDMDFPPPPPPLAAQEDDTDDAPSRNRRRRRSRSREDRERGGQGRAGVGEERLQPNTPNSGFREQSV